MAAPDKSVWNTRKPVTSVFDPNVTVQVPVTLFEPGMAVPNAMFAAGQPLVSSNTSARAVGAAPRSARPAITAANVSRNCLARGRPPAPAPPHAHELGCNRSLTVGIVDKNDDNFSDSCPFRTVRRAASGTLADMATSPCAHLSSIKIVEGPDEVDGCDTCLVEDTGWVHLRMCMTCGEVGCCDDSPGQHARKHAETAQHPVMRSIEGKEWWSYCFLDDATFYVPGAEPVAEVAKSIFHNEDGRTFVMLVDSKQVAWLKYEPVGAAINIVSTTVGPGLDGLGYEGELLMEAIYTFSDEGRQLIPSCEFARAYIGYRPELHDTVVPSMRARMLGDERD